MKKLLAIPVLSLFLAISMGSCKKDDNGGGEVVVEASPVKTLGVVYTDGTDSYTFTYDANKRVSQIINEWNGVLDKTIVYDWSTPGKLKIISNGTPTNYELNAQGYVSKEYWNDAGTEYASYEYDANGYLVKINEFWDGVNHLKMQAVIQNGNTVKHTKYNDAGVATTIKEFSFSPGDNVNEIQQTNMVDNNTKPLAKLFGKASKKIVSSLTYWDPRENPIVTKTSTMSYEFDAKNRPVKVTKTLFDGSKEISTYAY